MTATATATANAAPKKRSNPVTWTGRQIGKAVRFSHRQYARGRDSVGDVWAVAPPAALGGAEYLAHENIPAIENSGATDDMLIASTGAAALSGVLTLAAAGRGLDINRKGVKRGIETVSAGVASAADLAMRIQVVGTEIGHNPVLTWVTGAVAVASATLGGIAGYSSGRALSQ